MAKKKMNPVKKFLLKNRDVTTTLLGLIIGTAIIIQEQMQTGTITFTSVLQGIGTFALSYFIGKGKEFLNELDRELYNEMEKNINKSSAITDKSSDNKLQ